MKLDAKHLATLEVIRREGGLTRAASTLGTSQPALSRLVNDLEIRLDAPIFDRTTRPWALTKLGQALARHGAAVLLAQERASNELSAFRTGAPGTIRLAGPPFFTDGVISRLLPGFRAVYGDVAFEISYGYASELRDAVRLGRADIAFYPRGVGERQGDLVFTRLLDGQNVIACREGHPILRLAYPRPLALLDYGWIVPPAGSPLAADLEAVLRALDMHEAEIVFSGGSLASVLSFLEGSDCLAVLPEGTVNAIGGLFGIRKVPIEVNTVRRVLGMLTRPMAELDHATLTFIQYLREAFEGR